MKSLPGKTPNRVTAAMGVMFLLTCIVVPRVAAQVYEATLDVPVTFWDFRSDRSNPEFEQPHTGGHVPGMVQALLDEDGKPIATPASPNANSSLNQGIRFWFRDWNRLSDGTYAAQSRDGNTYLNRFRPIYSYMRDANDNSFSQAPPGINPPQRVQGGNAAGIYGTNGGWQEGSAPVRWVRNATTDTTMRGQLFRVATAYENREVPAIMTLVHTGGGIYQFSVVGSGAAGFFPLNDNNQTREYPQGAGLPNARIRFPDPNRRPFPTSPNWVSTETPPGDRNYAFTMEMKTKFRMVPGLTFNFTGDDDVWLFINNRLVSGVPGVDLGGIHEAVNGSVRLDDIMRTHGLEYGREYDFHLFYAERHSDDSNIRITTNIVGNIPTGFVINVDGANMIAGEPKLADGEVQVEFGDGSRYQDFSTGEFTWRARDEGGFNTVANGNLSITNASRTPAKGTFGSTTVNKTDSVNVTANVAHTWIWIIGTYSQPGSPAVTDSVRVWVAPGAPAAVFIEPTADSAATNLRAPNPIGTISISPSQTSVNNFYAILRDRFGNWVGPARTHDALPPYAAQPGRSLSWVTEAATIATAEQAPHPGPSRGQGQANRVADQGRTNLTATYTLNGTALTPGTAVIEIQDVTYEGVEIRVMSEGGYRTIARSGVINPPLEMLVGEDTTLYVFMQRSDTREWVLAPGAWTITNIPGVTSPSGTPDRHTLLPTGPTPASNGNVSVAWPAQPNLVVNLPVVVVDRDAGTMRFFTRGGPPDIPASPQDPNYYYREWLPLAALPSTARMYPVPAAGVITIPAGARLPIVPKMFTDANPSLASWLDYGSIGAGTSGATWTWSFAPGSPTNDSTRLSANTGDSISFRSTVAIYNGAYVVRAVFSRQGVTVTQDLHIRVNPDITSAKLVIEPNNQGQQLAPNTSQKIENLDFASDESRKTVYAVLRDRWNNYIGASGAPNPYEFRQEDRYTNPAPTAWTPTEADNKIVWTTNGYIPWGEGHVDKREPGDPIWIYAFDPAYNVRDSVLTRILDFYYIEVEIAVKCNSGVGGVGVPIPGHSDYCRVDGTLEFTTNDDIEVFVFGQRDDGETWDLVTGSWSRDPELVAALPNPPNGTNNWMLRPGSTGRGNISVSRPGSGGETLRDEIVVNITVGPPQRAEIVIITPPEERIAGQPIQLAVRYYNRAGLMVEWNPAWTNLQGSYFEGTLGRGGDRPEPGIRTPARGDDYDMLFYLGATQPRRNNAVLTVTDGVGGFTVLLYLAAENHQIRYEEILNFGGGTPITAISEPFTVLPGPPSNIQIVPEGNLNPPVGDTLTLNYRDPDIILCAQATDQYGNPIGGCYPSDWNTPSADDGVPRVDENNRPLVPYRPGTAEDNGFAEVCATVPGMTVNGNPVRDCITIRIVGVTTLARSAITRDYDGCGYLDAIELKFPKAINLTDELRASNGVLPRADMIRVTRGTTPLNVASVSVNLADSTAVIRLEENRVGGLQTSWTPTLIIEDGVFIDAGYQQHTCQDGAAPVISSALITFPSSGGGSARDNYIDVTFSENVRPPTPGPSSFSSVISEYKANDLFNVWTINSSSSSGRRTSWMSRRQAERLARSAHDPNEGHSFTRQRDYLLRNERFFYINDSTLRFNLEEGQDISPPRYYMNIRTDASAPPHIHVWDNTPLLNRPDTTNRKVPVGYRNPPGPDMRPIPNPARPDDSHVRREEGIHARHDDQALDLIRNGGLGGTVLEVPIYIPTSANVRVRCQLKVYDLAGNLVIAGQSETVNDHNAFRDMQGQFTNMHLYWNGFNARQMMVAPGTYRMVVYISYHGTLTTQEDRVGARNKRFQGLVGMSK